MLFNLRTEKCPCCGKEMMNKDLCKLFPFSSSENQEAQMKKAGVVFCSSSKKDDKYICVECEAKGFASFICALCGERRNSNDIKESIGDPPDRLCKHCYSTVSAETWENKVAELERLHKYDYE